MLLPRFVCFFLFETALIFQKMLSRVSRSAIIKNHTLDEAALSPRNNYKYYALQDQTNYMHSNLKILFAEDEMFSRMFTLEFLQSHGYDIVPVADGREAVDACKKQHFDVIILDISMPNMDGVQASRIIRNDDTLKNNATTPIIALTSLDSASDVMTFFEVGMNYYLRKPPDLAELKNILIKIQDRISTNGSPS